MRPSALQLRQLVYDKLSVESFQTPEGGLLPAQEFDFNGVNLAVSVNHNKAPTDRGTDHMLSMKLRLENQVGKAAPYLVDISAIALFDVLLVPDGMSSEDDFVKVNGASIVYSSIRDMLLTITSRSLCGPLLLPSANFQDLLADKGISSNESQQETPADQMGLGISL